MCHNMETSYMDFGYDAYVQSYPDTMHVSLVQAPHGWLNESLSTWNEYYTNGWGDNAAVEPEDDDDPDGGENVSHENSI